MTDSQTPPASEPPSPPPLDSAPSRHRSRHLPSNRALKSIAGIALLVAVLGVLLITIGGGDAFGSLPASPEWLSYLTIFLLIAGDAVIPIFPGETTLNAASALASRGDLSLVPVIVAGALGAIVGDSTLFWIARRNSRRVKPQLERAKRNKNVAQALSYLDTSAAVLLVCGRYVPGLRFVVNSTMGLSGAPYRAFLPWSALGGALWATYTCLLAYWVGSTLDKYPLASVVVSGAITTLLIAIYFLHARRARKVASRGEPTTTGRGGAVSTRDRPST
jgi:membrane-associated protein